MLLHHGSTERIHERRTRCSSSGSDSSSLPFFVFHLLAKSFVMGPVTKLMLPEETRVKRGKKLHERQRRQGEEESTAKREKRQREARLPLSASAWFHICDPFGSASLTSPFTSPRLLQSPELRSCSMEAVLLALRSLLHLPKSKEARTKKRKHAPRTVINCSTFCTGLFCKSTTKNTIQARSSLLLTPYVDIIFKRTQSAIEPVRYRRLPCG